MGEDNFRLPASLSTFPVKKKNKSLKHAAYATLKNGLTVVSMPAPLRARLRAGSSRVAARPKSRIGNDNLPRITIVQNRPGTTKTSVAPPRITVKPSAGRPISSGQQKPSTPSAGRQSPGKPTYTSTVAQGQRPGTSAARSPTTGNKQNTPRNAPQTSTTRNTPVTAVKNVPPRSQPASTSTRPVTARPASQPSRAPPNKGGGRPQTTAGPKVTSQARSPAARPVAAQPKSAGSRPASAPTRISMPGKMAAAPKREIKGPPGNVARSPPTQTGKPATKPAAASPKPKAAPPTPTKAAPKQAAQQPSKAPATAVTKTASKSEATKQPVIKKETNKAGSKTIVMDDSKKEKEAVALENVTYDNYSAYYSQQYNTQQQEYPYYNYPYYNVGYGNSGMWIGPDGNYYPATSSDYSNVQQYTGTWVQPPTGDLQEQEKTVEESKPQVTEEPEYAYGTYQQQYERFYGVPYLPTSLLPPATELASQEEDIYGTSYDYNLPRHGSREFVQVEKIEDGPEEQFLTDKDRDTPSIKVTVLSPSNQSEMTQYELSASEIVSDQEAFTGPVQGEIQAKLQLSRYPPPMAIAQEEMALKSQEVKEHLINQPTPFQAEISERNKVVDVEDEEDKPTSTKYPIMEQYLQMRSWDFDLETTEAYGLTTVEQLHQADIGEKEKSEFVEIVSKEMLAINDELEQTKSRTPVGQVVSSTEVLSRTSNDELEQTKSRTPVGQVVSSIEVLSRTSNDELEQTKSRTPVGQVVSFTEVLSRTSNDELEQTKSRTPVGQVVSSTEVLSRTSNDELEQTKSRTPVGQVVSSTEVLSRTSNDELEQTKSRTPVEQVVSSTEVLSRTSNDELEQTKSRTPVEQVVSSTEVLSRTSNDELEQTKSRTPVGQVVSSTEVLSRTSNDELEQTKSRTSVGQVVSPTEVLSRTSSKLPEHQDLIIDLLAFETAEKSAEQLEEVMLKTIVSETAKSVEKESMPEAIKISKSSLQQESEVANPDTAKPVSSEPPAFNSYDGFPFGPQMQGGIDPAIMAQQQQSSLPPYGSLPTGYSPYFPYSYMQNYNNYFGMYPPPNVQNYFNLHQLQSGIEQFHQMNQQMTAALKDQNVSPELLLQIQQAYMAVYNRLQSDIQQMQTSQQSSVDMSQPPQVTAEELSKTTIDESMSIASHSSSSAYASVNSSKELTSTAQDDNQSEKTSSTVQAVTITDEEKKAVNEFPPQTGLPPCMNNSNNFGLAAYDPATMFPQIGRNSVNATGATQFTMTRGPVSEMPRGPPPPAEQLPRAPHFVRVNAISTAPRTIPSTHSQSAYTSEIETYPNFTFVSSLSPLVNWRMTNTAAPVQTTNSIHTPIISTTTAESNTPYRQFVSVHSTVEAPRPMLLDSPSSDLIIDEADFSANDASGICEVGRCISHDSGLASDASNKTAEGPDSCDGHSASSEFRILRDEFETDYKQTALQKTTASPTDVARIFSQSSSGSSASSMERSMKNESSELGTAVADQLHSAVTTMPVPPYGDGLRRGNPPTNFRKVTSAVDLEEGEGVEIVDEGTTISAPALQEATSASQKSMEDKPILLLNSKSAFSKSDILADKSLASSGPQSYTDIPTYQHQSKEKQQLQTADSKQKLEDNSQKAGIQINRYYCATEQPWIFMTNTAAMTYREPQFALKKSSYELKEKDFDEVSAVFADQSIRPTISQPDPFVREAMYTKTGSDASASSMNNRSISGISTEPYMRDLYLPYVGSKESSMYKQSENTLSVSKSPYNSKENIDSDNLVRACRPYLDSIEELFSNYSGLPAPKFKIELVNPDSYKQISDEVLGVLTHRFKVTPTEMENQRLVDSESDEVVGKLEIEKSDQNSEFKSHPESAVTGSSHSLSFESQDSMHNLYVPASEPPEQLELAAKRSSDSSKPPTSISSTNLSGRLSNEQQIHEKFMMDFLLMKSRTSTAENVVESESQATTSKQSEVGETSGYQIKTNIGTVEISHMTKMIGSDVEQVSSQSNEDYPISSSPKPFESFDRSVSSKLAKSSSSLQKKKSTSSDGASVHDKATSRENEINAMLSRLPTPPRDISSTAVDTALSHHEDHLLPERSTPVSQNIDYWKDVSDVIHLSLTRGPLRNDDMGPAISGEELESFTDVPFRSTNEPVPAEAVGLSLSATSNPQLHSYHSTNGASPRYVFRQADSSSSLSNTPNIAPNTVIEYEGEYPPLRNRVPYPLIDQDLIPYFKHRLISQQEERKKKSQEGVVLQMTPISQVDERMKQQVESRSSISSAVAKSTSSKSYTESKSNITSSDGASEKSVSFLDLANRTRSHLMESRDMAQKKESEISKTSNSEMEDVFKTPSTCSELSDGEISFVDVLTKREHKYATSTESNRTDTSELVGHGFLMPTAKSDLKHSARTVASETAYPAHEENISASYFDGVIQPMKGYSEYDKPSHSKTSMVSDKTDDLSQFSKYATSTESNRTDTSQLVGHGFLMPTAKSDLKHSARTVASETAYPAHEENISASYFDGVIPPMKGYSEYDKPSHSKTSMVSDKTDDLSEFSKYATSTESNRTDTSQLVGHGFLMPTVKSDLKHSARTVASETAYPAHEENISASYFDGVIPPMKGYSEYDKPSHSKTSMVSDKTDDLSELSHERMYLSKGHKAEVLKKLSDIANKPVSERSSRESDVLAQYMEIKSKSKSKTAQSESSQVAEQFSDDLVAELKRIVIQKKLDEINLSDTSLTDDYSVSQERILRQRELEGATIQAFFDEKLNTYISDDNKSGVVLKDDKASEKSIGNLSISRADIHDNTLDIEHRSAPRIFFDGVDATLQPVKPLSLHSVPSETLDKRSTANITMQSISRPEIDDSYNRLDVAYIRASLSAPKDSGSLTRSYRIASSVEESLSVEDKLNISDGVSIFSGQGLPSAAVSVGPRVFGPPSSDASIDAKSSSVPSSSSRRKTSASASKDSRTSSDIQEKVVSKTSDLSDSLDSKSYNDEGKSSLSEIQVDQKLSDVSKSSDRKPIKGEIASRIFDSSVDDALTNNIPALRIRQKISDLFKFERESIDGEITGSTEKISVSDVQTEQKPSKVFKSEQSVINEISNSTSGLQVENQTSDGSSLSSEQKSVKSDQETVQNLSDTSKSFDKSIYEIKRSLTGEGVPKKSSDITTPERLVDEIETTVSDAQADRTVSDMTSEKKSFYDEIKNSLSGLRADQRGSDISRSFEREAFDDEIANNTLYGIQADGNFSDMPRSSEAKSVNEEYAASLNEIQWYLNSLQADQKLFGTSEPVNRDHFDSELSSGLQSVKQEDNLSRLPIDEQSNSRLSDSDFNSGTLLHDVLNEISGSSIPRALSGTKSTSKYFSLANDITDSSLTGMVDDQLLPQTNEGISFSKETSLYSNIAEAATADQLADLNLSLDPSTGLLNRIDEASEDSSGVSSNKSLSSRPSLSIENRLKFPPYKSSSSNFSDSSDKESHGHDDMDKKRMKPSREVKFLDEKFKGTSVAIMDDATVHPKSDMITHMALAATENDLEKKELPKYLSETDTEDLGSIGRSDTEDSLDTDMAVNNVESLDKKEESVKDALLRRMWNSMTKKDKGSLSSKLAKQEKDETVEGLLKSTTTGSDTEAASYPPKLNIGKQEMPRYIPDTRRKPGLKSDLPEYLSETDSIVVTAGAEESSEEVIDQYSQNKPGLIPDGILGVSERDLILLNQRERQENVTLDANAFVGRIPFSDLMQGGYESERLPSTEQETDDRNTNKVSETGELSVFPNLITLQDLNPSSIFELPADDETNRENEDVENEQASAGTATGTTENETDAANKDKKKKKKKEKGRHPWFTWL